MKEKRTTKVDVRLTKDEKELIKRFCEKHNITLSEFVRLACQLYMCGEMRS